MRLDIYNGITFSTAFVWKANEVVQRHRMTHLNNVHTFSSSYSSFISFPGWNAICYRPCVPNVLPPLASCCHDDNCRFPAEITRLTVDSWMSWGSISSKCKRGIVEKWNVCYASVNYGDKVCALLTLLYQAKAVSVVNVQQRGTLRFLFC
jgi:hypothetical protein